MPICRVKNCLATRRHPDITLHQFPKDPVVRKHWLEFCGCDDGANLFICSKHFRPLDYENILMTSARRKLRKDAVPTIRDQDESDRASRVAVRNRKKLVNDLLAQDEERCREAANYNKLVSEVLKPYNWSSGERAPQDEMLSNLCSDNGPVSDQIRQTLVPRSNPQQLYHTIQFPYGGGDSGSVAGKLQQKFFTESNPQQQYNAIQRPYGCADSGSVAGKLQQKFFTESNPQQQYNAIQRPYGCADSGSVPSELHQKVVTEGNPQQQYHHRILSKQCPYSSNDSGNATQMSPPKIIPNFHLLKGQQVITSRLQDGLLPTQTNQGLQQKQQHVQQTSPIQPQFKVGVSGGLDHGAVQQNHTPLESSLPIPQYTEPLSETVTEPMEITLEPFGDSDVGTLVEQTDDTLPSQISFFNPVLNSTVYEANEISSNCRPQPGFVQVKRGTIKKLKMENLRLREIVRSLRAEIKEKDTIVRSLSRQSQQKSKEIQQLRTQNADHLAVQENRIRAEIDAAFGLIFTKNQIDLILKRKKKVKWTDDEIMLAFSLRYHSQPAYELVRKEMKIPLPCLRRLREFAAGMDMRGGFLEPVFSVLGSTSKFMSPMQRVVIVACDELKVKEAHEQDKRNDIHIGPHKEMQVIAIRGLFSKWKTPIFVDFDRPMSVEILNEAISRLHEKGFTVAAIVHDNGGGNLAMLKQAGINHANQKVSIEHPVTKEEIFFFPDAPHLLKLIRNWLLDNGFYYKGKLITKYFLVELVKKASTLKDPFTKSSAECSNVELNALFKLTMKHVTCEGSERQNVRLAAQLLSHTTAVNLRRHFGEYEEAVLLAEVIDIINSWFDTMNSSRINESIPDKQCYGMAEEVQNRNLDRMAELMSNMRTLQKHSLPAATHLQIFQKSVLISIQSLKRLLFKMRLDFGITFIMTFKLDQDFLENLFAMIRLNGGSNDHPSPLEALHRIKLIILGKSLNFPMSTNQNTEVKEDVNEHFLMSHIFRKKQQTTVEDPDEQSDEEDIEPWTYEPKRRALEELDGQHYVYGYMAKSLKENHDWCGKYTHELENSPDDHGKENYVEDLSRGGLVQPSQQWTEVADQMEDYFNFLHNRGPYYEEPAFRNSKNICKRSMIKMSQQFPDVPHDVIKQFVKTRVNIRIRHLNKQLQEKKTHRYKVMKNNKRQKQTDQKTELTKNQKKLKHFLT